MVEKTESSETNVNSTEDNKPNLENHTEKKELTQKNETVEKEIKEEIKDLTNLQDDKNNTVNQWSKYWKTQYDTNEVVENNKNIAVI